MVTNGRLLCHTSDLRQFTSGQLTELLGEMESLVGALSETLIAELALRDELEYEKELKNQFISLLLAVQNRRRQHHVTKKRCPMQNPMSPLPQHRSFQDSKVCLFVYFFKLNFFIKFVLFAFLVLDDRHSIPH